MKYLMMSISFITLMLISSSVYANQPQCHSSSGGYCSYEGKVKRVYVRSDNLMLMYFENSIPVENATVAGLSINSGVAGAYKINENPDFAKMLYSTLLAAVSQDRIVSIQLRGTQAGYLKIDRIWFGE